MRIQVSAHVYAVGEIVSVNLHEGESFSKLNPFTVEAQMPPVGVFLQYRIKSNVESYRRVVSEHQLSSVGQEPTATPPTLAAPGFDEGD